MCTVRSVFCHMLLCATGLFVFVLQAVSPNSLCAASEQPAIQRIDIVGLKSIAQEELLYLLDLKPQQSLDEARVRAGIKRAFLKGIFEDIRVERSSTVPLNLLVTVRERPKINRIEFAGTGEIPTNDFLPLLLQKVDDRFRPALAQQSCEKIAKELQRRGYTVPHVSYRVKPEDDGIALAFALGERSQEIIRTLVVDDPANALPLLKGISAGDFYDATAVDAIVEKAKTSLAKRNYVNNSVTTRFNDGRLEIRVRPGNVLEVDFAGNHALGNSALRKETTFFDVHAFSENLVEESLVRIRLRYRQIGYPNVEAVPVIDRKDDIMTLTYYIDEGKRQVVRDIVFEGATLPRKILLEQLSFARGEPFNHDLVDANRESLQQYYHGGGYLSARVSTPVVKSEEDGIVLVFPVIEGTITRVGGISITGNHVASHEVLLPLIPMKQGEPYSDSALSLAKLKIGEWYQKNGYADVYIDAERTIVSDHATIAITIQEGAQSRFGKHIIVGNESTKHIVLERELLHKEGGPYNPALFLDERMALNRTGLFSSIDVSAQTSEQGTRDIVYKVQEAPAGALEFGFGYAEYEQFRTFFDVSYRNLWGMNRQIQFRVDSSSLLHRATLSYYHPWAFGERNLAFKALMIGEKKKELNVDNHDVLYRSDRYGVNIGFEKTFSPALKAELMYDLANVHTYDVQPGVVLSKEDTGTLIISGMHLSVTYDQRDNALDPTHGYLLGATYKLTGPYFLSETNFNKLVLFANAYTSLSKKIVAAFSVRSGLAKGFGSTDSLPIVERFFLGGRTSVRGYRQDMLGPKDANGNPIGGDAFLMGNAELRIKIWKELGMVAFMDAGNVWKRLEDLSVSDLRYTAGVGLRYNTPVGPLRVDYGRKLNREQGESHDAIHFSIGHAF